MDRDQRLINYVRNDFRRHTAKLMTAHPGESEIAWFVSGCGAMYSIDYHISGRHLFVSGDYGCAVYKWSENIDLQFLADCNLHYFAEKCVASEMGAGFRAWDSEVCEDRVLWALRREAEHRFGKQASWPKLLIEYLHQTRLGVSKSDWRTAWDLWQDLSSCMCSAADWAEAPIRSLRGQLELGDSAGLAISVRCIAHLVGLQEAFKQLNSINVNSEGQS